LKASREKITLINFTMQDFIADSTGGYCYKVLPEKSNQIEGEASCSLIDDAELLRFDRNVEVQGFLSLLNKGGFCRCYCLDQGFPRLLSPQILKFKCRVSPTVLLVEKQTVFHHDC
jgi:hypothetical protein